ncbi:MAG TPA: hypothetical protein VFV85_06365, partial [Conexibacter sp.]|nr:hypothetical protein [Conexibacter sp.]
YYGVNAQLALGAGAARTWRRSAAQIARLGVGTVRRDAFWSAIEPLPPRRGRHRYRWRATDRLVAALAASGLRWYPIVDYGVAWASGGDWRDPPTADHVGDYGAFAAALAGRYGVHGAFWRRHPRLRAAPVHELEVWNEPNVARFWPDQLDAPARLAAMYLAARERVKTVDPPARVVLGGLSAIDLDAFLAGMVQASPQLVGHLDAVGFHPYGGGPDAGLQLTYARIRDLRAALSRLFPGERVPIEVTETGWAVPPVPEAWRARRLRRLALELPRSNCDVTRLIVHTWTSADRGASPEAWFGIAYPNGRLRPSGAAFRAGVLSARRDDPASAAGALTC